jgi:hypothetical protein
MLTQAPDRSGVADAGERREQMPIKVASVAQYISGYRSLVRRRPSRYLIYAVEIVGISSLTIRE